MTTVINARNLRYATADNSFIACEVIFSDAGAENWLPFTVSADHPQDFARKLYTDAKAGVYGDITAFNITPEMIAQAKAEKHSAINQWRDMQEHSRTVFELDGHTWDCSKASQDRLAPVTAIARSGKLPEGFFWTDAGNNDVPVTAEKLYALEAGMLATMVTQGFKIHERQRQMKAEIDALTDLKAVTSYIPDWDNTEIPSATDHTAEAAS